MARDASEAHEILKGEYEARFTFRAVVVLGVWGEGGCASSWLMKKTSCERHRSSIFSSYRMATA